ncbi:MAG TPA: translesion error-prone DNA polymerase V autoproteolytic subunit [Oligoflexia bacterium]|nr:translesion error-prone DNA polymerase V autoproteolytic subunit [Oligoflexia bacterium]HMR24834.1 translesion error-prone DNA polymerase V autoproteolytic subunit [Oligoflexia bacterium]
MDKEKSSHQSQNNTLRAVPKQWGGKRKGAGRPAGQGPYGEATKPVRIPVSMVDQVHHYVKMKGFSLPLYSCTVSAGFPSPAEDYVEGMLDLNEHLIQHPAATFFVRVSGDSMIEAGIHEDDLLIVDRSIEARHGRIVIAVLNNELTVKRLHQKNNELKLMPENKKYKPIVVHDPESFMIWGVVTNVIHAL